MAVTIKAVWVRSDRRAGGAAIVVVGTGFAAGASVLFGGVAATGVTVVSATRITCTAPAYMNGTGIAFQSVSSAFQLNAFQTGAVTEFADTELPVDVSVVNSDGSSATFTDGFTYYTPLSSDTALASKIGSTFEPEIVRGSVAVNGNTTQATSTFSVLTPKPVAFSRLRLGLGSLADNDLIFSGLIRAVDQTYNDSKDNIIYNATGVDSSQEFNRHQVWKRYTNVSASVIGADLLASYAPMFTGINIVDDLPLVTIEWHGVTMDTAFAALATLIGGYYYRDDSYDVHLFQSESPALTPDDLDASNTTLQLNPPLEWTYDVQQTRNRVTGLGAGTKSLVAVTGGSGLTSLPVQDISLFDPSGTVRIGAQTITYTSVQAGGAGTLVGTGVSPTSAPTAALGTGAGVDAGVHLWAYSWATASGETIPSPTVSLTVGPPASPTVAASVSSANSNTNSGDMNIGDTVQYAYSWSAASSSTDYTQETSLSGWSALYTVNTNPATGNAQAPWVNIANSTDPRILWIHVWKKVNGGSAELVMTDFAPTNARANSTAGGATIYKDTGHAATAPPAAATLNQVALAGIAVGPGATTSRKIYRTAAGGTQLKLMHTLADNTTTTYTDAVADASLGANAPTSDTSGLTQPSGQVVAGATTIPVASAVAFSSGGGWVIIGNGQQAVRYTGISGGSLTGIPSSGPGSIVAAVNYNSTITATAALFGIPSSGAGSFVYDVLVGDAVSLWSQRDDTASQAAVAALEGALYGIASDGIYEYPITDTTITSQAALDARCDAELVLFSNSQGIITLTYTTLDPKSRVGRPVHVDLPDEGLSGDFVIQTVNLSEVDTNLDTPPLYQVTASSVRFSLDDVLRRLTVAQ